jgi:sulfide dehydrogenase [flavocytochrome c] flavoprotein chain
MTIDRREFIKIAAAGAATGALPGCAIQTTSAPKGPAKVVVIGAGYGGATTAKYLRVWSNNTIDVTVVDRNDKFVSCPMSNTVFAGMRTMDDITRDYETLKSKYGVKFVIDEVTGVDPVKRTVATAKGTILNYDRLVIAPGVDFMYKEIEGASEKLANEKIPHAWKAGPQTLLLRKQMEAMPDGGVILVAMPKAPYRCPPGPYERVCLMAQYLKDNKPKSKIIMLDANEDVASKPKLFKQAWAKYGPLIEYKPNAKVVKVNGDTMTLSTEFEDVKGDVINLIPPQSAGEVTAKAGLGRDATGRWIPVSFVTYEAKGTPNIHCIGDAILSNYPRSGHMANNMGKIVASALVEIFAGREPDPVPVVANTCYSLVSKSTAVHVAAVFRYNKEKDEMTVQPGTLGTSPMEEDMRELEKAYADSWATNIWNDMFA